VLETLASLRWGEITVLTRNDLDLERRTVCIPVEGPIKPQLIAVEPGRSQNKLCPG
jgi:hypothetical protein